MVEGDVHHGLPKVSSHFSDSITSFPSDQVAQRATKQLRSHLPTPFPSFLSLNPTRSPSCLQPPSLETLPSSSSFSSSAHALRHLL